tara:strand:+ start:1660 stop:2241 length:582 start_codon:yes stop_codon:yes gene_type:complete
MTYGDLQFFDLILFAGIAVFLIFRLKNVLGKRTGHQGIKQIKEKPSEKQKESINKIPQLKENETKLSKVYEVMEGFDHKVFLEGAKFAFETIINAFNNGDKKTLKNLLTTNVLQSFEEAIDSNQNEPGYQFYSLVIDSVEDVWLDSVDVNVKLKIISEQFKDGDEGSIVKKNDVWTFQKKIKNTSPIWLLSAT